MKEHAEVFSTTSYTSYTMFTSKFMQLHNSYAKKASLDWGGCIAWGN